MSASPTSANPGQKKLVISPNLYSKSKSPEGRECVRRRHHCFAVADNKTSGGGDNSGVVVVMRCNRHVLWSTHISQQFLRSANNERAEQIACGREVATMMAEDCARAHRVNHALKTPATEAHGNPGSQVRTETWIIVQLKRVKISTQGTTKLPRKPMVAQ